MIERDRWPDRTRVLRGMYARHREMIVLAGGFASGMMAGFLPLRGFARVGGSLVSVATFALRNPLGTLLVNKLTHPTPPGTEQR